MLLPRSALVACGPRPGARGKKHDLFSTPAFASGQWRTRRGGRAPGRQQRAAGRGASAPRRVRPPPPEEGKPRLQPPHAVPAPRARSGPRPRPRAAPRPRPAPAACPRPSSGGERWERTSPLREQAGLASATAAARAQRARPQRSAGPRRPPARLRERQNPVPSARGPHAGVCRSHSPARFACAQRRRHTPAGTPPSASTNPPGGGGGGGGGGRTGGAGRRPETAPPPRPYPAPPRPSVPPTGRHRHSSLVRTSHASAQPRPAAKRPCCPGTAQPLGSSDGGGARFKNAIG